MREGCIEISVSWNAPSISKNNVYRYRYQIRVVEVFDIIKFIVTHPLKPLGCW